MSGKQDNMRELDREEMSRVSAGAGAEIAPAENGTPIVIDPVIPDPVPVPEEDIRFGPKCKCGHCGYIVDSHDAGGRYYYRCPNCKQRADWVPIGLL